MNSEGNIDLKRFWIQKWVGHIIGLPVAALIFFIMRFILQYRIADQRELRKYFKELIKDDTPLLICTNHLTYLDSGFIMIAFGSVPWYALHYKYYSWNLPAVEYSKNLLFRFVIYLNKGVFIRRGGGRNHITETLDVTRALLEAGEVVTIFPEGTRSKTGFFQGEKLKHGAAKVIAPMKKCRVLCCYIGSDKQDGPSSFPAWGSTFTFNCSVLEFEGSKEEFRGTHVIYSEMMSRIGSTIKGLETVYFKKNGKNFTEIK